MRSFLPSKVPWGRPVVADIPLPPFATGAERQRFTRMLQLHVAMVDDGPSLAAKALAAALTTRGAPSSLLTALELEVALATFFPAPWTPAALAEALAQVHRHAPRALPGGRWDWDFDPVFTATPGERHGWEIERNERGTTSTGTLEADGDLVILWMDHFREHHPFPYGWRVDEAEARALAAAAKATREAHAADAALPYLANWRRERNAYLDEPG
jgi:hypothetical protein